MNRVLKISVFMATFLAFAVAARAVPSYTDIRNSYGKSDTSLVDRRGEPLYEIRTNDRARRLDWTPLDGISPALVQAVVFAEDRRFFEHRGVDYRAVAAAIAGRLGGENLRGASTVTMQLASFLNPELRPEKGRRTVFQKAQQMMEAREIEKSWTKNEILDAYLNLVSYRGEIQGIAAASRGLFGKAPHGLGRAESVVLASLIRTPNAGGARLCARAAVLGKGLQWLVRDAEIRRIASRISSGPFTIKPGADLAPHAARLLIKKNPGKEKVACSIDAGLQRFTVERLRHHVEILASRNVGSGAALVIDNKTGRVLAYASRSSDPLQGWYVDGVQAKRQAGSTLKPFLYALAFEKKILTPASVLDDGPLDIPVFSGIYRPHNYEDDFKGPVTTRVALASSLNIPAVRTILMTGIESFLARLRRLAISKIGKSGDYYGPSLALGSIDVSLWELTNAYRCLARGGLLSDAHFVPGGKAGRVRRVFSPGSAFLVSDILSDREARSATFGLENPLSTRFWTAVKTGTSKDMRDNWCVGYSRRYTVGVWVGNFNGESMHDVSGISGAAPVWAEIMDWLHAVEGKEPGAETPRDVVRREVCLPGSAGRPASEWFIRGTEPVEKNRAVGQINRKIVYPPTGAIIAIDPDIPPELQKVFFISGPRGQAGLWLLDGRCIAETGLDAGWAPEPGAHHLCLGDEEGNIVDSVQFEVRGGADK